MTTKNTAPAFDLNLASLVKICTKPAKDRPAGVDSDERQDALNVQAALADLGQRVSLEVAAGVWRHYSNSILAGWLAGADTIESAKEALQAYVQHAPPTGFSPNPPGPAGWD